MMKASIPATASMIHAFMPLLLLTAKMHGQEVSISAQLVVITFWTWLIWIPILLYSRLNFRAKMIFLGFEMAVIALTVIWTPILPWTAWSISGFAP